MRDAVDAATVTTALRHLARLQSARSDADAAVVTAPIDAEPFFGEISADARLVAIATALLGAPARAFGCTYVVKPARTGLPALWHQDGHPWRTSLGIASAVTLWLALDAADGGNGCLRVIPGSHSRPAEPLRPNTDVPSVFGWEIDPARVDDARAVDIVLAPGDASAHHPDLVHGSDANRSDRPRRALAIRYRASPP